MLDGLFEDWESETGIYYRYLVAMGMTVEQRGKRMFSMQAKVIPVKEHYYCLEKLVGMGMYL